MVKIALTDPMGSPAKAVRYPAWILRWIPDAEVRMLSYRRDNLADLERCDGLVLSGGGDIDPLLYNRPDVLHMVSEVDTQRDAFELKVIETALRRQLPVLGICRGTQLFNVVHGGTLMPDIEASGHPSHRADGGDRRHVVEFLAGSRLGEICGVQAGEVNSAHHQAIDRVGGGLRVAARSADGITEAIEWEDPRAGMPVHLVQWHPERMDDTDNPLTQSLILHFASTIQRFTTT
jgi:putative glutamine amidotransferase